MTAITDADLARWAALAEAATPGPWQWEAIEPDWSVLRSPSGDVLDDGSASGEYAPAIDPHGPDAALIAEARTAVPLLVEEVRRLRAELALDDPPTPRGRRARRKIREWKAMIADRDRLRAALRKYGRHRVPDGKLSPCTADYDNAPGPCTCGLAAALADGGEP